MKTQPFNTMPRHTKRPLPRQQRGISLFVAITALALMTVAGLSLMRSVDTANQIAGNMAFKNAGVNASDLGVEAASVFLNNVVLVTPDNNIPNGCTVGVPAQVGPPAVAATNGTCRYSSSILAADTNGLPLIDWANTGNIPITTIDGNDYQFVIERLCTAGVPVSLGSPVKYDESTKARCALVKDEVQPQSKKAGVTSKVSELTNVMYRVTVRVRGPRNTTTFVQSVIER